jgi:hypothetical protein
MIPTSVLCKVLYWPVCRAYARHIVGDRPADALLRFLCSPQFWRVHRFWPNFVHPRRFTEKLWSRMLHDRDPQLILANDKLRVRDYVAAKVGNECLVPLLWSGDKPEEIPFHELPAKYVIKTNHGCGFNVIVKDKTQLDEMKTTRKLRKWLATNFCQDKYLGTEWGYKNVRPSVVIEAFLDDHGKAPVDYKFYCFHGRVEFVTVHFDRFVAHKTRAFDRDFQPYEFRYDFPNWDGECDRPWNFEAMVLLAERLAEGFDFMRVDLYSLGDKIYFSELTPYPGGVSTKFLPATRDYILGEKWKGK